MWEGGDTSPCSSAPRIALGTAPPATKPGTRTPPSQIEPLPPRSGWLEPPAFTVPPLSLIHTISVLFHQPRAMNAAVTVAVASSTTDMRPWNRRLMPRSSSAKE